MCSCTFWILPAWWPHELLPYGAAYSSFSSFLWGQAQHFRTFYHTCCNPKHNKTGVLCMRFTLAASGIKYHTWQIMTEVTDRCAGDCKGSRMYKCDETILTYSSFQPWSKRAPRLWLITKMGTVCQSVWSPCHTALWHELWLISSSLDGLRTSYHPYKQCRPVVHKFICFNVCNDVTGMKITPQNKIARPGSKSFAF